MHPRFYILRASDPCEFKVSGHSDQEIPLPVFIFAARGPGDSDATVDGGGKLERPGVQT
jgi:hypothetical protein